MLITAVQNKGDFVIFYVELWALGFCQMVYEYGYIHKK